VTIIHVAEACPDPYGHARLYSMREQTWRAPAEHSNGCPWCGGDTPGSVADDDLRAELASEARHYAWLEQAEG
jgi:hypothetical protein